MSRINRNSTLLLLAALAAATASCDAPDATPARAEILPELAPVPSRADALLGAADSEASSDAGAPPDASPAADAAPPRPPALADDPPSDEKTKAPTKAEWSSAPEVRLARTTDKRCSAKRIREWVRVWCEGWYTSLSLVSGTRDGLEMAVRESEPSGLFVIFPARKGDRRLILVQRQAKWSAVPEALISEQWLETDKGPIVTVVGM